MPSGAVERYRDRWLLVLDKPAGVPTQRTREGEPGLYEGIEAPYVGLHHRLDRPASGLVLFTLDASVNAAVAAAFREHRVERLYAAVLVGEQPSTRWDRPLEGKPARTDLELLAMANGMSAVTCRLHTGRTHQIRQHAALAGRPVAGDRRYGGESAAAWPRLALHARRLALRHPVTREPLVVESPLPDDLTPLWHLAGGPT